MDLTALQILVEVSRAGSFAAVAEARGVAPSSISRSVANLEAEIGVRLFHRTTRRVSATEAGQHYLARVIPLVEELEAAREEAVDLSDKPTGRLRVTASTSFGQVVLAPLMRRFCDAYPGILPDLNFTDRQLDLVENQIDVAIRHGVLQDSSMISTKLMPVRYRLVASPDYLNRAGAPTKPEALKEHSLLTFPLSGFQDEWVLSRRGVETSVMVMPRVLVNNAVGLREMSATGHGIALLADWTVSEALATGQLIEVLPNWRVSGALADAAIWIAYPSRSFLPSKTRVFIEFLKTHIGARPHP